MNITMESSSRMNAGRHYTYLHRQADTGEIFYVGKGTRSRANDRQRRSQHWKRVAVKHGLVVEVVAHWPTEEEALLHEMILIDVFRSSGHPLVNLTAGGGGMTGWKASDETKARMSAAQLAPDVVERKSRSIRAAKATPEAKAMNSRIALERWQGPSRDKRLQTIRSPEFRAAASELKNRQWLDPEYRARHSNAMASTETRARMSASMSTPEYRKAHAERMRRLGKERQRKVLCVETGFIFESGKEAAESMGLLRSKISKVCNGKAAQTGGYSFRFVEESKK